MGLNPGGSEFHVTGFEFSLTSLDPVRGIAVGVVVLVIWLLTRIPHRKLREASDPGGVRHRFAESGDGHKDFQRTSLEVYEEFLLGHIEFDDQGSQWDGKQWKLLREHVLRALVDRDALIVVFVHGWNNNAHDRNENLISFRRMLKELYDAEALAAAFAADPNNSGAGPQPRRVVGVYASWRGLSSRLPVVKRLTYWARKRAAHRIGSGDLVDVLVRLEQIRFARSGDTRSRLIIIGHSFGGAAVYSAISGYVRARAVEVTTEAGLSQEPPNKMTGFGDLVVLVNPAFEANLYGGLDWVARNTKKFNSKQHVVSLVVSASNDGATRFAFPAGQFFGRLLQKKSSREQRKRIWMTVGNYPPYRTHRLAPRDPKAQMKRGKASRLVDTLQRHQPIDPTAAAETRWEDYKPENARWVLEEVGGPYPARLPFIVAHAESRIVDGHGGIFRIQFIEFLRDFMLAQDAVHNRQSVEDESSDVVVNG